MGFIDLTRQNIDFADSIEYKSGLTKGAILDNVGYIGKILVRVSGKMNAKHASKTTFVKAFDAPWNLLNRLRLTFNGKTETLNCSGYMLYLLNKINKRNYNLDEIVSGSDVFSFGNVVSPGGTDNDINFTLEIPVSINDRDTLGLMLMQAREMVANLSLDWSQASVVATDTDVTLAFTGSAYITTEWYTAPQGVENQPPQGFAHTIFEDQINLVGIGETPYDHARAGSYRRAIMLPIIDDAPAANAAVEKFEFYLNRAHKHYSIMGQDMRTIQRDRYGKDLPLGVYVWDWAYQGIPNLGNHRDYIHSGNFTKMQTKLFIASGTSMGTNNNVLRVLREQIVQMQKRSA